MIEVIPAIIGKNITEIAQKILLVAPYVRWVQIDVSDGIFTPNTTWNRPEELKKITAEVSLELHLMVANPAEHMSDWIASGAKRIIVHVDSASNYDQINTMADMAKSKGVSLGIALSLEVQPETVKNLVPLADLVLLLAVSPGFSGQQFDESILEKIRYLRRIFPDVIIEIDGGITPPVAKKCVAAGANMLVSSSYIFGAPNIKEAIEELKRI